MEEVNKELEKAEKQIIELTNKLETITNERDSIKKQYEEHKTELNNENKGHRLENKELLEKLNTLEKQLKESNNKLEKYADYDEIKEKADNFTKLEEERIAKDNEKKQALLEKLPEEKRVYFEALNGEAIEAILKDTQFIQEGNSKQADPLISNVANDFTSQWNQQLKG